VKIYAGSIFAQRKEIKNNEVAGVLLGTSVDIKIEHGPRSIKAENKHMALGMLLEHCHATFPVTDNWTNHSVNVVEVPDEWYVLKKGG
jgi:hypothetical protein